MNRKFAVLALLSCAACYSSGPSLGTCNVTADCTLPDGGELAGVTCNQDHLCEYPCTTVCAAAEACVNAACELQGPRITSVTAPTTWSPRSQQVTVTAVVDDTGGPGIASAVLRIPGASNIVGATSQTGLVRTYTFIVDGSVQAPDSEAPIAFTVVATDTGGGTTPDRAAGTGQLLIDDRGPTVNGATVNGGVAVGPAGQQIRWFAQSQATAFVVDVSMQDNGSSVLASSLTLVVGGTRIDSGTPTCTGTITTPTCHFSVTPSTIPTSVVPTGDQRRLQFSVAGTDVAGNAVKTNQAAVGIDGKPPTIAFTPSYPAAFADCNGGAADGTMYCGHDGSHFWRAGDGKYSLAFTVNDAFTAPNDVGSGASPSASTCSIAGSTAACTVTFNASNNTFTFPADFATATFTSAADGSGTVSVTVNANDAVGNAATAVTTLVNVTRLKWMRSMATKVDTIKGSPVVTSVPVPQIMFAGSERDSSGPLVSLAPDGAVLWRAGHTDVTTIALGNVAYSSTTQRLYVAEDNALKLVVYAVGAGGVTGSYNCVLNDGVTAGHTVGSPVLFGGTTERAIVADDAGRLWSLTGTPGAGCATVGNTFTNNSGTWGNLNPPTTDGSLIYLPHNVTKLSSVAFNGTSFGTVTDAGSFSISVFGSVAIAGSLFFGDRSVPAHVFSYSTAFTQNWATVPTPNPLADGLNAPTIVDANYAFASPQSGDGQLHAFNKGTGAEMWHWETGTTKSGNISAPSFGADGAVFFGSSSPAQLFPLKVVSSVPSLANNWSSSYKGSSSQNTAGVTGPPAVSVTNTTVDGLPTEPVIDASGVLYFATGTSTAKVFALITDSGGPLAPVAGTTWPRVGYDNCNSSNTSFNCQ